jgi:hypothetical protein
MRLVGSPNAYTVWNGEHTACTSEGKNETMRSRVVLCLLTATLVSHLGCGPKKNQLKLPSTAMVDPSQYSLEQYKIDLGKYDAASTLAEKTQARNNIAYGLMTQIEEFYGAYYKKLFGGRNSVAVAGDAVTLGLGAAGAIATNSATQAIFAALNTGLNGLSLSIDKNFYAQQSFQVIGTAMQTRRDKLRKQIMAHLTSDDATKYPLTAAKRDLIEYWNAGTLAYGLQELQEEAGTASAVSKGLVTPKQQE